MFLSKRRFNPHTLLGDLYLYYRPKFMLYTGMRRITTFRSTMDRMYDSGPIRLYYNTYHCVTIAYSIQYSNMLYRFVA